MKKILFAGLLLIIKTVVFAQILQPVKWSYASKRVSNTEAVVVLKAKLDKGWHLYSQYVKKDGPVATTFTFSPSNSYSLIGKTIEPKPITKFEEAFKMNVSYFENSVIFQQKVKIKPVQTVVKGKLEFMACNDKQCLPPDEKEFSIVIK